MSTVIRGASIMCKVTLKSMKTSTVPRTDPATSARPHDRVRAKFSRLGPTARNHVMYEVRDRFSGMTSSVELEKELKGKLGTFYYVKVDLCSEENILEAFNWVKKTLKSVDVLVNNAGVWKLSDFLGNTNDWKQMYDTNVIGLTICSREAIKIMEEIKIKQGHIININSFAGHNQISFIKDISVYAATKHSVTSITDNLRELMGMKDLPIRVTSISPGAVETEMTEEFRKSGAHKMMKAIDIVDAIMFALSAPQRVNVAEIILTPTGENILGFLKNSA